MASFTPAPSMEPAAAAAGAEERWQLLADCVHADAAADARERMRAPLGCGSWRVDVSSVGRRKPRDLPSKVGLIEQWDMANPSPSPNPNPSPHPHPHPTPKPKP